MAAYTYNGVDYDENGQPITDQTYQGQIAQPGGGIQAPSGMSNADMLAAYQQAIQQGMSPEDAINAAKAGNAGNLGVLNPGYEPHTSTTNELPWIPTGTGGGDAAATTTQAGTGGGGAGGGGGYGGGAAGGSLIDPFTQSFQTPANYSTNWRDFIPQTPSYTAPRFTPPSYKPPPAWSYQDFVGPNAETVLSRPGYKFRLDQGEQALANAKAAQGIYGTGATLKAILGYGQDYASNEFNNEWNRSAQEYDTNRSNSLGAYNTNYQTQTVDPYRIAYQGAQDAFAPQMAEFNANVNAGNLGYSTQAAAAQRANESNYNNAWSQNLFDYEKFKDQRDSTFNHQFAVLGL